MEKEVFKFEVKVNGKEIAEKVMKEMNKNIRMEKNKKVANAICKSIQDELHMRRKVDYIVDSENICELHAYINDYDYLIVRIKLLTQENKSYLEIKEYVDIVMFILKEKDDEIHRASTLEKVLIDMLEECKEDNDFYIMNGLLCHQGVDLFDLSEIEEYHVYNGEDMILTLYEDDVKYLILFNENRVEEVE
ncbi:hypothetical protein GCM10008908_09330 [Clostridium subterminale]|uniref:Uncharacterized protein n=2 Tax=Clostridium subterminale TaxID=1550 RepID=A0ABN1KK41_CLOSU